MKLFAALSVPGEIASLLDYPRSGVRNAVWHRDSQLHVTLRYFGDCTKDQAEKIHASLQAITAPAFPIRVKGVTTFTVARDVVYCAKIEPTAELTRLAEACNMTAEQCDAPPRNHAFLPHITLGLLDGRAALNGFAWSTKHAGLSTMAWNINRFGLYETTPDKRYQMLADYTLR